MLFDRKANCCFGINFVELAIQIYPSS